MSEHANSASAAKVALDRAMRLWRLGHRHDGIHL